MGRLPIVLCSLARISAPRAAAVKRLETLWGRATLAATGLSSPAPVRLARGHRLRHLRADRILRRADPESAGRGAAPDLARHLQPGAGRAVRGATGTVAAIASLGTAPACWAGLRSCCPRWPSWWRPS